MSAPGNINVQKSPSATTLTALYECSTGNKATLTKINICNRGGGAATFRVSIGILGAADAVQQYLYYDATIAANTTVSDDAEHKLNAGDILRVYASSANFTFHAYGYEEKALP